MSRTYTPRSGYCPACNDPRTCARFGGHYIGPSRPVVEPPIGFEPMTLALQERCSTTELRRRAPVVLPGAIYSVSGTLQSVKSKAGARLLGSPPAFNVPRYYFLVSSLAAWSIAVGTPAGSVQLTSLRLPLINTAGVPKPPFSSRNDSLARVMADAAST